MMPNMDPRTLRNLMAKMGIKSSELNATRVVIEMPDKQILIEQPQVTKIEAQGSVSFQIAGIVTEMESNVAMEVTEDDIKLVSEATGISDREKVKAALEKAKGNIAQAIMDLEKEKS
ncbi:MAG: hypothetical protein KGH60_03720 [Candidatus Micrarchaeota archaeon]|nr:hypothetical protein [Candidatus Micrarchaeota archaeon]